MPYENQLLGAFIFALGQASALHGTSPTVNLFQQTPLDQRFGDLIAGTQWCMAIEFKRARAGLRSEALKWKRALAGDADAVLRCIRSGTRGHWICYGCLDQGEVVLLVEPYLSTFQSKDQARPQPASRLIQVLAKLTPDGEQANHGVSAAELAYYLDHLQRLRKPAPDGGSSASWLCAFATGDSCRFLVATSLPELLEKARSHMDIQHDRIYERESHQHHDQQQGD